jgi:hypothetical protein
MRVMRRIGGLTAGLLALLAAQPLLAADDVHSYSLINASASRVDFADEHAQLAKNGFVTFSILTVFPSGKVAYSLAQVSINCNLSQIATLANENHAANGAALPSEAVDSTAQPISTGTLGQALHIVVCTGVDPYPRSKVVNGVAAAVAKAHDLFAAMPASK